jgi:hypothetical protein
MFKLDDGEIYPTEQDIKDFILDMTNHGERIPEKRFYEALTKSHPTLQQAWFRIMKQVIFAYADAAHSVDDRNQASVEWCKAVAGETDKRPNLIGLPSI